VTSGAPGNPRCANTFPVPPVIDSLGAALRLAILLPMIFPSRHQAFGGAAGDEIEVPLGRPNAPSPPDAAAQCADIAKFRDVISYL
jgi:hypothetical protein